jgi:DNA adenine methylase
VPTSPIPNEGSDGSASANCSAPRPEPFLKWPGGKRWLVATHPELLRRRYRRYIEPFLGGGSVFFFLRPQHAILGDLNADVIVAYRGIQADYRGVELLLEKYHLEHCAEHYYRIRDEVPLTLTEQAARIIYLNRTCFNGIYRVNKLGKFNVPIGTKKRVIRTFDNFDAVAKLLARAELLECDFEILIDRAELGDLLFLDPPYTVRHNNNGFIKYNENLFSWQDQERLAKAATRAVERGAEVIVTNASHPTVRALYSARLFTFRTVSRFSAVSATASSRKQFEELIIISDMRGTNGGARRVLSKD